MNKNNILIWSVLGVIAVTIGKLIYLSLLDLGLSALSALIMSPLGSLIGTLAALAITPIGIGLGCILILTTLVLTYSI